MPEPSEEVQQASDVIIREKEGEEIIYHDPSSQALLMSYAQENRFAKNKAFNGFVLHQESKNNNEFLTFLKMLKNNAKAIPPGTRIQLAVLNSYVDKRYEELLSTSDNPPHWLTIDVLVGNNGHISSFVLDGVNYIGHEGVFNALKKFFPSGDHYVFKVDEIELKGEKKRRYIQTQSKGCDTFAIDHARQLSQIDAQRLYDQELAKCADSYGIIRPGDFLGDMKLTRVFRGMQSWSGLNSLPEEVKQTIVKESSQESLIDYVKKRSKRVGQENQTYVNRMIDKKSARHKERRHHYFETLSPEMRLNIMHGRQGYAYLQNPFLFDLSSVLSSKSSTNINEYIATISELLSHQSSLPGEISSILKVLEKLSSSDKKPEEIKNELMLSIAAMFTILDKQQDDKNKQVLTKILRETLPMLSGILPDDKKNLLSNMEIVLAIYNENTNQVKQWLALRIDQHVSLDSEGNTALHLAAQLGNEEMMHALIDLYPRVDMANHRGETPLYAAALHEHEDLFKFLVEKGANPSNEDNEGNNLIHLAAKAGHVSVINMLHKQDEIDINKANDHGQTPLALAVMGGHIDAVAVLVELDADVNPEEGISPLILAARSGNADIVEFLLEHDAETDSIDDKTGNSILHDEAILGNENVLKVLLDSDIDPNQFNREGVSPLMMAVRAGKNKAVETLLECDDIDLKEPEEMAIVLLQWAHAQNNQSIISTLYDKLYDQLEFEGMSKITEDLQDNLNTIKPMLLYEAVKEGHADMVELLVKQGVSISYMGENNQTILHAALKSGGFSGCNPDMLRLLTSTDNISSIINKTDEQGQTPLHIAAEKGRFDLVSILFELNPNVNKVNNNGATPLGLAIKSFGDNETIEKIVASLIEKGANPREDKSDPSLISIAVSNDMSIGIIASLLKGGARLDDLNQTDQIHLLENAVKEERWDVAMHVLLNVTNLPKTSDSALIVAINKHAHLLKTAFVDFVEHFNKSSPHRSLELNDYIAKIQHTETALARLFDKPLNSYTSPLGSLSHFSGHDCHDVKICDLIMKELAQSQIVQPENEKHQYHERKNL
jgi:uncharacterized protein